MRIRFIAIVAMLGLSACSFSEPTWRDLGGSVLTRGATYDIPLHRHGIETSYRGVERLALNTREQAVWKTLTDAQKMRVVYFIFAGGTMTSALQPNG